MAQGINFKKIWLDDDVLELCIEASDGNSSFSIKTYIAHKLIDTLITDLNMFKNHIYGGLCDIEMGKFGPEYTGGAFHGRCIFMSMGNSIFL